MMRQFEILPTDVSRNVFGISNSRVHKKLKLYQKRTTMTIIIIIIIIKTLQIQEIEM